MKKYVVLSILCLGLIFNSQLYSQSIGIDFTATNLGSLPDTINLNNNYNHYITLQNKNAVLYTGNIRLYAGIDSSGSIISIDSVGVVSVSNFGLNDTAGIAYSETYDFLSNYVLGSNIVVVWGVADIGTTADSLSKNVFIKNPVDIKDYSLKESLSIYPNPSIGYLYFNNYEQKFKVKRVRIYDISGHLVYDEKFKQKIDISHLPTGTYIIKIVGKEEVFDFKLIKE